MTWNLVDTQPKTLTTEMVIRKTYVETTIERIGRVWEYSIEFNQVAGVRSIRGAIRGNEDQAKKLCESWIRSFANREF